MHKHTHMHKYICNRHTCTNTCIHITVWSFTLPTYTSSPLRLWCGQNVQLDAPFAPFEFSAHPCIHIPDIH